MPVSAFEANVDSSPIEGDTMNTATTTWNTKNKVGLGLAVFYGIINIPSLLIPTAEGEDGPPLAILIVCSVLGVVAAVAAVVAWRRGSQPAARLAAASIIVITISMLPAFFVDVPAGVKALSAAAVVLTVVTVVLMFSTSRRATSQVEVRS